jgi:hypothetical protein
MFRIVALLAAAALLVGCAAQPDVRPRSADDPANPHAPESPVATMTPPLSIEPVSTTDSDTGAKPPPHTEEMPGMDMPGMPNMQPRPERAATAPATQPIAGHTLYTCRMHPQVVSDHPGNCPICGMKLVKKTAQGPEEMNK